jgi:hypothetical protein
VVVVVVGVGVSAATIAATSSCTWPAIAAASPVVGQAPPPFASTFAQTRANFASHFARSGGSPRFTARAVAFSKHRS